MVTYKYKRFKNLKISRWVMFKKWGHSSQDTIIDQNLEDKEEKPKIPQKTNTILKGSKLIGDIIVTCDLELSGEIEGNITSEQDSNIIIKGACKGNIETRGGDVSIEGELHDGNISAGNDVKIYGRFNGGVIKAKGKIHINGEFNGKLEGNEIEIGAEAQGKGEIFYREYISISKGADFQGQISKIPSELKLVKTDTDSTVVSIEPSERKVGEVN
jgi:cytoskeletal protein CcmA (bactofilin family)